MPSSEVTYVSQLLDRKLVTNLQLNAAVDAYLADPTIGDYPLADGYTLNLSEAAQAFVPCRETLADPDARDLTKWLMVCSAFWHAQVIVEG